ncbi:uncharacterized protein FOMMEDRAFT_26062 [Fomitiporia mediterranea MF3/22]|uniref:uncharacterized protein n=1 Tax=Fomitiporia mediterranea (strain MF3/22) TaxID=694068 RepID=UPI000440944D|nr:uncharacterized protein FOMMEDRAFT_26062 [Fomitiporia mediterranea MF3/22]EJD06910.1 hypothetical protein FOMMEDRAFT_26062 [Fomitiporia mediterranea MF3/22]
MQRKCPTIHMYGLRNHKGSLNPWGKKHTRKIDNTELDLCSARGGFDEQFKSARDIEFGALFPRVSINSRSPNSTLSTLQMAFTKTTRVVRLQLTYSDILYIGGVRAEDVNYIVLWQGGVRAENIDLCYEIAKPTTTTIMDGQGRRRQDSSSKPNSHHQPECASSQNRHHKRNDSNSSQVEYKSTTDGNGGDSPSKGEYTYRDNLVAVIRDSLDLASTFSVKQFKESVTMLERHRGNLERQLKELDAQIKQCHDLMDEDHVSSENIKKSLAELDRRVQRNESEKHFVNLAQETKRIVESTGNRQKDFCSAFRPQEELKGKILELDKHFKQAKERIDYVLELLRQRYTQE